MAYQTLTFTGNEHKIYDLEALANTDTRLSTTALKIHVHEYDINNNESPTPIDTVIGQIWLSKKVDAV